MKRMAGMLIVVLIALCGGVQAETLRSIAPRTVDGERIVELFNTGLKPLRTVANTPPS